MSISSIPIIPTSDSGRVGISPKLWGYTFWRFLHLCATLYPVHYASDIHLARSITRMVKCIHIVLPCSTCRAHFYTLTSQLPVLFDTRYDCIQWLFEAHNIVNVRLHKEPFDRSRLSIEYNTHTTKEEFTCTTWKVLLLIAFEYRIDEGVQYSTMFVQIVTDILNITSFFQRKQNIPELHVSPIRMQTDDLRCNVIGWVLHMLYNYGGYTYNRREITNLTHSTLSFCKISKTHVDNYAI